MKNLINDSGRPQRRIFRPSRPWILAAALFILFLPDRCARADPEPVPDMLMELHITEFGEPFHSRVELSFRRTWGTEVMLSISCWARCIQKMPSWIIVNFPNDVTVEPVGRDSFILESFYIHYNPYHTYINYDELIYKATIDIGTQTCQYTPNEVDVSYSIDGCTPSEREENASPDRTIVFTPVVTITEPVTPTINTPPSPTIGIQPTLTGNISQTPTVSVSATPSPGEFLTATPSPGETPTAAPGGQEPSPYYSIPEIVFRYLLLLSFTICLEGMVVYPAVRFILNITRFPFREILLFTAGINALTLPVLQVLMATLVNIASLPASTILLLLELLIVIVEAIWYNWSASLRMRDALLISLCANALSFLAGVLISVF